MKNVPNIFVLLLLLTMPSCGFEWFPASDTPAAFTIAGKSDTPLDSIVVSDSVTPTGYSDEATITATNGEVSIAGGTYTHSAKIKQGQSFTLRHTSSSTPSQSTVTTVSVGGFSTTWTSTTEGPDTTPTAFSFASPKNPVSFTDYSSGSIKIAGINQPTPISITGGLYALNGSPRTSTPGSAINNDLVKVFLSMSTAGKYRLSLHVGPVFANMSATKIDPIIP